VSGSTGPACRVRRRRRGQRGRRGRSCTAGWPFLRAGFAAATSRYYYAQDLHTHHSSAENKCGRVICAAFRTCGCSRIRGGAFAIFVETPRGAQPHPCHPSLPLFSSQDVLRIPIASIAANTVPRSVEGVLGAAGRVDGRGRGPGPGRPDSSSGTGRAGRPQPMWPLAQPHRGSVPVCVCPCEASPPHGCGGEGCLNISHPVQKKNSRQSYPPSTSSLLLHCSLSRSPPSPPAS
jgi:hypothetical protein